MQYNCTIEISETGRIMRIKHENGRIIADILIHGYMNRVLENCHLSTEIENGRANIFRGELYQLAAYEYLNIREEKIEEKI